VAESIPIPDRRIGEAHHDPDERAVLEGLARRDGGDRGADRDAV
jgi:hypothetical protein